MANIYGRQVVIPLTNKSGGGVIAGDVVVIDTTNNDAFTTTTSVGTTNVVGVAQETIANNATGRVLTAGYAALVNTSASVTRGNYGKTHSVAKQAVDAGSSRINGTFCKFLTGGTTPDAVVFNPDVSAAGNVATDAIWTTSGKVAVATGTATATEQWPPGHEFDYVAVTSALTVTAVTEGTAQTFITGSSVAYDGSTIVIIEVYCPGVQGSSTNNSSMLVILYEDSTLLGIIGQTRSSANSATSPMLARVRRTPSNASHQYIAKVYSTAGTDGVLNAGTGGTGNRVAAYLRVIKV